MRLVLALALCLGTTSLAAAQERKPEAHAAASAAAEPVTFNALLVTPEELPKDVKIVEGLHCVWPEAATLYASNEMSQFKLPLLRKAAQSFEGTDGKAGTAVWFEYEGPVDDGMRGFLENYLWGAAKGPDIRRPEQLWIQGKIVLVLSAERGSAGAEWWKARARSRFGLVAPRWSPELADVRTRLWRHLDKKESDAGLALLAANDALVAQDATAQYYRGALARLKSDWPAAEKSYRRALELHATRVDPLPPQTLFSSMNGLGFSLLLQTRYDEAAAELREAVDLGRAAKVNGWGAASFYLASAHARAKRWPESLAALKDAIGRDPNFRDQAKTAEDLAEAVARPEFKELLGL